MSEHTHGGNRRNRLDAKLMGDYPHRLRSWRDLKLTLSTLISLAGPWKNGEQSQCQLEASLRDKGIIVAIEESPGQMTW